MRNGTDDGAAATAPGVVEGKAQLLSGIERDARAEGEGLRRAAGAAAAERLAAAKAQAALIREDAARKAEAAARGIARQGEQSAAVETRRMALKVRERIFQRVVDEAGAKLAGMVGTPAYRAVLKGWIVEAALGLNVREAEVLASGPEMTQIDDGLLAEASREAAAISSAAVTLRRSAAQPLAGQGVVVTSADGKTAFNNQVATRMERYQSEIRKLIYEALKES